MKLSQLIKSATEALMVHGDMPVVVRIKYDKVNDEADATKAEPWLGPDCRPQRPQFYVECVDE